jgi:hypothetical protein
MHNIMRLSAPRGVDISVQERDKGGRQSRHPKRKEEESDASIATTPINCLPEELHAQVSFL